MWELQVILWGKTSAVGTDSAIPNSQRVELFEVEK
jgi:hypothetical protein